jgi:GTP-binding protein
MKPVIAIVGRANVGKSALFNRLVGEKMAIVEDLPGTTRDRIFADTSLDGNEVTLIDTGGLDPLPGSPMNLKIRHQIKAAITEADIIIFLVDSRSGILATDHEIADMLRKSNKQIILAASKVDNARLELQVHDFYKLGLGIPIAVSAHHSRGIYDLVEKIISLIPQNMTETTDNESILKLAIVGRPNAGKSMLLNTIVGEERAIVDSIPGTTRDATDTIFQYNDQHILLIDTAGIRHRGRLSIGIEYYSLIRSLRAINRCDIALLVIDATEFVTTQDIHIAGYIREALKGLILIVNKWDLVPDKRPAAFESMIKDRIKFIAHIPVLFVSAKEGIGIN